MKEPLRVLHVVSIMNRGGMESRLMDILRKLDRNKVQFDFLYHRMRTGDFDNEICELGGRIYHIAPMSFKNISGYRKSLDQFFYGHPEYMIVHSQLDAMSTPVLKSAFRYNIPVRIAHSRSAGAKPDWKLPIRVMNKLFIKKYATHYLACSKKAAIWLFGKAAVSQNKVLIVKNAIDARRFSYNEEVRTILRESLGLQGKYVVGHVGSFLYPKNHSFLIEIFDELLKKKPDAMLLLVGGGKLLEHIREQCRQRNLSDRVILAGKVSNVNEYLQAFDVFVFPSHFEGMPGAVIEAQASGLHCIISDVIDEEVRATGFVKMLSLKQTAESWANAILDCTGDMKRKDTYEEIKAQGYDVQTVIEYLEEFYLSCAGEL